MSTRFKELLEVSTLGDERPSGEPKARTGLSVTIACHPDLARVGDVFFTTRDSFSLSRSEPVFIPSGTLEGQPLLDAGVSRAPIEIASFRPGDGAMISANRSQSVRVDDDELDGSRALSSAELADGVFVSIRDRVGLVLRESFASVSETDEGELIGMSSEIAFVREQIRLVSDSTVPVLIVGETGSGKELVARAIHRASPRASAPFVPVNVATLLPTTAASELFGHVRGAFTGADRSHDGVFVRAGSGTLFLDEIGELPLDIQAMLLRTLESKFIRPVGSHAEREVDVRVVAATDADLEAGVSGGTFRSALFHRLSGYQIPVPPLRQRREDIPRLFVYFLRQALEAMGESRDLSNADGTAPPYVPAWPMARMVRAAWPGNVRELRNVVTEIALHHRGRETLGLTPRLESQWSKANAAPPPEPVRPSLTRKDIDDELLVQTLKEHAWAVGPTAAALGIPRSSLYDLMDKSARVRKATSIPEQELRKTYDACAGDLDAMSEQLCVSKRGIKLRLRDLGIDS